MVQFDRTTGNITTDKGDVISFYGNNVYLKTGDTKIAITYERIGDGMELELFNDLEKRGIDRNLSSYAIDVVSSTLRGLGFSVNVR